MHFIKKIIITFIFVTSNVAFADSKTRDYDANYYEDEGQLLFKIRAFYASTSAKPKSFSANINAGAKTPSSLVKNGFGVETATTYFFTDNIAAELSLGVMFFRVKSSALAEVFKAYGTGTQKNIKNNDLYMIPLAATAQYHIAPYGGVRPYIGAGYSATFMFTRSKAFKSQNAYGPVLQAGIDLISKDDTLFTFDVKQYLLTSKLTYKNDFLGISARTVSSKITWNPIVFSAGFGFKF